MKKPILRGSVGERTHQIEPRACKPSADNQLQSIAAQIQPTTNNAPFTPTAVHRPCPLGRCVCTGSAHEHAAASAARDPCTARCLSVTGSIEAAGSNQSRPIAHYSFPLFPLPSCPPRAPLVRVARCPACSAASAATHGPSRRSLRCVHFASTRESPRTRTRVHGCPSLPTYVRSLVKGHIQEVLFAF